MADQAIQFPLNVVAWSLLGLDDEAVVEQVYPSLRDAPRGRYEANESDARAILDALETRAGENSGYDHDASERRALRNAANKLRAALRAES